MTDALTIVEVTPTHDDGFPILPANVPVPIDPASAYLPVAWDVLQRGAQLVASCPGIHPQLSKPENAMFIAYQAARWRMDPVMVGMKTYFTDRKGGGLAVGYEAQLVHALVETDPDLLEPLDFQYGYSDPKKPTAANRFCKVVGRLRTATKPRTLTTPTVGQVKVKNSSLWFSDPDQQLSYYGARAWARRFRPGRLLGVYTKDEIESYRDADRGSVSPMFEEDDAATFDGIQPDAPPDQSDHKPEDLDEVKAWAFAQRDAILAMTDPRAAADAGNAMLADSRFGRLKAYELATAKAIDRSVGGHIKELQG